MLYFPRNWSTDGMTTTVLSSSQVLCTSNHLTSFAVLVDHSGVTSDGSDEVCMQVQLFCLYDTPKLFLL